MASSKKPKKISVAAFEKVFRAVSDDIAALHWHDLIFRGVAENLQRFPRLGRNFPGFFGAFYAAMRTDLIIRLGRIYDPEGTGNESCTLARCLHLLRDNTEFFTDSAIKARLREDYRSANPDYLVAHRLDRIEVISDLHRIERSRVRLIRLRHKEYAHRDLETVLSGKRDGFLSAHNEVKELIQLAHEIWNRYSQVWNASTSSGKVIGSDDYQWLFKFLRRGIKAKSVLERRQFDRLRRRIAAKKEGD